MAGARPADRQLRRAGRELRPRRARPHGHHLGAHPGLNPRMIVASVKGFGPGPYEDCKVYENVAQCAGGSASTTGDARRPADGHRRADRRQRHRPAPGAGHRRRAVPAHAQRPRPEGAGADAGRRAQPVPRQAARPAAPGAHAHHARVSAVPRRQVRRRGAARRQRLGRRPARRDPQVQGLGDRPQRLHLLHHPGGCVACGVPGDRRARLDRPTRPTPRRRRGCCT